MKWPKDFAEAGAIQEKMRGRVRIIPLKKIPSYIAGVDAAFRGNKVIAAACLYTFPQLNYMEDSVEVRECSFPYVPGYLTFREGPAIVAAVRKLKKRPDMLLVDGQGIAHPKGIGIASHLGVLLNMPSIGCAKSRLIGEYDEPAIQKGAWSYLRFHDMTVGIALRTRSGVKPVFVSPGHRTDLACSIMIVMACIAKFRIPEPIRKADILSKQLKRELFGENYSSMFHVEHKFLKREKK